MDTFTSSQLHVITTVAVDDQTNDEHQGYTDWCADVPAVRDAALARRILAAADGEIDYLDLGDGACTRVDIVTGALDRRCEVGE